MSNKKKLDIPILYEDDDCLVINKPAGLIVHPDGKNSGPFLTDWIIDNYPETKDIGESMVSSKGEIISRPGIIHRLDRETSGAMIVAKTKKGYENLKKQFQDRLVAKKYLAFVWGKMKEEFGTINRPIARSSTDFRLWSARKGTRGESREAETYWTRIANSKCDIGNGKFEDISLIEAEPKTGRTHQIRVHFIALQHPVVGDRLYAPYKALVLGFGRLALHSRSITFSNIQGNNVTIKAPLPEDFLNAIKELDLENLET